MCNIAISIYLIDFYIHFVKPHGIIYNQRVSLNCHNIGTVLRFRCKSECAILSMPKDAKAHFYDTEHHPFEGGVLCFRAIGQFAGDDLQGHPFPHFCITGGITSEKT